MEEYLTGNNTISNITEEIAITEESSSVFALILLTLLYAAGILIFCTSLAFLTLILMLLCCDFYFDGWEGVKIGILNLLCIESKVSNEESNNETNENKSNLRYLIRNTKIDRTPDPITSSPNSSLGGPPLEKITNYFAVSPESNNQPITPTAPPEQNTIGFVLPPESNGHSN
ncbi:hypothetical protein NEIRO03_2218 [Nematocida sp. AWRm78]|nr:hypothetical protein NEIRO02_2172 [Nematocida sp. AWRm79]KAI5186125.1 hypothetical protein NEIRO03_2218 [Nematocida sp. AWRm78]